MNTAIRLAELSDLDRLAELVCAFRDHVTQVHPSDADVASSVERLLGEPTTDFLVAFSTRNDAVGYVQLRYQYSLWVSGTLAQLEDLFVVSSFRRRGVSGSSVDCRNQAMAAPNRRLQWAVMPTVPRLARQRAAADLRR